MNQDRIAENLDKSIKHQHVPSTNDREAEVNSTSQKLSSLRSLLRMQFTEKSIVAAALLLTASLLSETYHNPSMFGISLILLVTGINISICTNKNCQSAEVRSLQGDLIDCTSPASVPVFFDFYAMNRSIDDRLNKVILTALTRLIPLYLEENEGRIPASLASRFLDIINLQTELEYPSLLCAILDGLDATQSTIFLPPVALLLAQREEKQVRKSVREAASRAYLRISESITLTELTDHTVTGWFTDLSRINIWTNYILSREEFTRLHHRISTEQFNLIPRMNRGSIYASLAKQKVTIDGRVHSLHHLGNAYSLAVIAFARDHKDIIASSIFLNLAQSQRTPEVVRSAAFECVSYLDQIKAGMLVEKTLLRPLETDVEHDTLLQPATENSVTDELILHVVKDNSI